MAPLEEFDLVSHHLDPKTLAISCCVCKSWFSCISSEHIWKPICTTHFPSLSRLKLINPAVPYYRLYAMASTAAKRRFQTPSKPCLALDNLIFTVNIFNEKNSINILSLEKPGNELMVDCNNGVFKFDIVVDNCKFEAVALVSATVTWNVVLKGWKGVFNMLECQGKRGVDWWFWEELPLPGCCSSLVDGGVVADLRLGITDSSTSAGNVNVWQINKVSVGMLSISKFRYVSVDDALRYLQHFLDRDM